MSTIDEDVAFAQGGDDGEETDASIQPVGYTGVNEPADPAVFNRIFQNLRRRTEVLRSEVRALKYRADYDGMVLWANGTVRLVTASPGYRLVLTGDLMIAPALAPGYRSGGRAKGAKLFVGGHDYAGTLGVNDLALVASGDYTGQRGYADGASLATAGVLSLGGNYVTVEIVGENRAGGSGSIRATVTGTPRRHVRITYGTQAPGVTIAELVTAINSDATLFGTEGGFGLRHVLRASTTSDGTSTSIPNFARTKLRGGYDAEAHAVTVSQIDAFFTSTTENLLRDGDGLAIGYPAGLVEPGIEAFGGGVWSFLGGRRQSLHDAPTDRVGGRVPNIGGSSTYGNLFNTAREPELIPGAIPLGRVVGDEFVFVDGTRLKADAPALYLGENHVTVDRIADLAAFLATTAGAGTIGYNGSPAWNTGTGDDPALLALPNTTVEAGLDAVVTQLSANTTNSSGARRVGAEAIAGTVATGNEANLLSVPAGSVRTQLAALLHSTLSGRGVGVNSRVNEAGHRLTGADPIHKDFAHAGMPASGAQMFRAVLHSKGDVLDVTPTGVNEYALVVLSPFWWDNGGADQLFEGEPVVIDAPSGNNFLSLTAVDATRFGNIKRRVPVPRHDVAIACPVVVVKVSGAGPSPDGNGYYLVDAINAANVSFGLRKFDGTAPDFTGIGAGADLTFYNALLVGGEVGGTMLRAYAYNGSRAAVKLGVGDPEATVLDIVYNDGTNPNAPGARFFGRSANWWSTRRVAGGAASRNTENILTTGDKILIDGVETGTPVDASLSHHHNSLYSPVGHNHDASYAALGHNHDASYAALDTYSKVVFNIPMEQVQNDDATPVVLGTGQPLNHAALSSWDDWHTANAVPAGYQAVGLVLWIEGTFEDTVASNEWDRMNVSLAFGVGGVPAEITRHRFSHSCAPAGSNVLVDPTATLVIPCAPNGAFSLEVTYGTNVNGGSSVLRIKELAKILRRI